MVVFSVNYCLYFQNIEDRVNYGLQMEKICDNNSFTVDTVGLSTLNYSLQIVNYS